MTPADRMEGLRARKKALGRRVTWERLAAVSGYSSVYLLKLFAGEMVPVQFTVEVIDETLRRFETGRA